MLAGEVIAAWFDAHQTGDVERARQLLSPQAPIVIAGVRLRNFDELRRWHQNRARDAGPDFRTRKLDIMVSDERVAVLTDLTDGRRWWRALTVYEVSDDKIVSVWSTETAVDRAAVRAG